MPIESAAREPAEPPRERAHLMSAGSGRSWYVSLLCLLAAVGLVAVLAEHTRASTVSIEISER